MSETKKKLDRREKERYTIENRPLTSTGFESVRVLITMPRRDWEKLDALRGDKSRSEWVQHKVKTANR